MRHAPSGPRKGDIASVRPGTGVADRTAIWKNSHSFRPASIVAVMAAVGVALRKARFGPVSTQARRADSAAQDF